jgi:hypothetical protein
MRKYHSLTAVLMLAGTKEAINEAFFPSWSASVGRRAASTSPLFPELFTYLSIFFENHTTILLKYDYFCRLSKNNRVFR